MKGRIGLGATGTALEFRQQQREEPLGGQLERFQRFWYFDCGVAELSKMYLQETIRCDFVTVQDIKPVPEVGWIGTESRLYVVSARRRVQFIEWLFQGLVTCYWGKRDLLAIFVRQ